MNPNAELTGLTWGHLRGYDALAEAARIVNRDVSTPLINLTIMRIEALSSTIMVRIVCDTACNPQARRHR